VNDTVDLHSSGVHCAIFNFKLSGQNVHYTVHRLTHPMLKASELLFVFSYNFGGIFILVLTVLYVNVVRLMTTLSK